MPKLRRHLAPIVREVTAVGNDPRMAQEAEGTMKPFGQIGRDEKLSDSAVVVREPSTSGRADVRPAKPLALQSERVPDRPVMSASLRERIIEQIEPSVAATVPREVLRRQIEEIIHAIANQERLELSGREQLQLADELTDDMTGYGPLRPLLLDESINDIMVNAPTNVYVERNGKLERVAVRFRDNDHIASVAQKIASQVGTARRRIQSDGGLPPAGREPGQHHLSRRSPSTARASPSASSQAAG